MSLSDELLDPIAGSNPAGVNLRYEPVYDEIKEARREDDDAPQGEWETARKTADPVKVIKLATDALSKQTKDLQIAAWLTEALLRRDGFGGLREGLTVMRGLAEKFWDHVYPEMEDDDLELRAAPLAWVAIYLEYPTKLAALNSRGHTFIQYKDARALGYEEDAQEPSQQEARAQAVKEGKLLIEDFDEGFEATPKAWYKAMVADIDGSLAEMKALEAFGDEKLGNDAPSFAKLRDPVEEVRRTAQQLLDKKLELDPDPIEEESYDDGASAAAAASGEGGGLPVEPTSAADAAGRIAAAARFLQHADPKNPASYLMLRGFRWGELRALGGGIDPKMLAAPPTAVRTRLKSFLLDQKWPELLAAAEGVMATPHGRGWLDLQRYVLTACDNLGTEYDPVAKAIRGALGAVLRDLPELSQQTLMDDTPTANRETLMWLREHVSTEALDEPEIPMPGATEAAEVADGVTSSGMGRSVFDRAMVYVRSGNPQKGIELLMQQAEKENSARDRFLRKAEAAGIMVDSGLTEVALPTLRQLGEQIETHQLEGWEAGEVVARPMALLFRCLRGLEGESEATQSLYQRIARLDPMQAMAATKEPVQAPQPPGDDGQAAD
jgi:type VI secretion system protein ImpA